MDRPAVPSCGFLGQGVRVVVAFELRVFLVGWDPVEVCLVSLFPAYVDQAHGFGYDVLAGILAGIADGM